MLQIPNTPLRNVPAIARLNHLQTQVDALASFEEKVVRAESSWNSKSSTQVGKNCFNAVKEQLIELAVGVEICNYCEESEGLDIEHILPKSLFPQQAFVWENYLLACKNCNTGYKLDCIYIFNPVGSITSEKVERGTEPATQDIAIINPRAENPMDLMGLDLSDFQFYASFPPNTREFAKVENTLSILKLNERGALVKYRKECFKNLKNALKEYTEVSQSTDFDGIDEATLGDPQLNRSLPFDEEKQRVLQGIKESILTSEHPTVWKELLRQSASFPRIEQLLQQTQAATW